MDVKKIAEGHQLLSVFLNVKKKVINLTFSNKNET